MATLEPGAALGASYRLIEPIGSGAAGHVWLIESRQSSAKLAAKILKSEHANDSAIVERFIKERSMLTGLRDENIVAVRDLVVEGETLALVMDHIPGGSLRDLLVRGPLPVPDALSVCSQVFGALEVAHGRNVIHRDIKPDNVLLAAEWRPGQRNRVLVTDFGVAAVVTERRQQSTGMIGTPNYMAPELLSHGQSTTAVDVYSAGILLYELLAGRAPFAGAGTEFTIAYRHVTSLAPRLDVPDGVWSVLESLLAKDPRQRPSAGDASARLTRLAAKHADLPALEPAPVTEEFQEIERPATIVRGALLAEPEARADHAPMVSDELPELDDADHRTILRPRQLRPKAPVPQAETATASAPRRRFSKRNIVIGGVALALIACLGVVLLWVFGQDRESDSPEEPVSQPLTASQQDMPLPSGLTVSRNVRYEPDSEEITLEITYSAQKSALTGAFLEVVPGSGDDALCPQVTWTGAEASPHQSSTTGIDTRCGWRLEGFEVPANGQVTVTGQVAATVADASELSEWLADAAGSTSGAIGDSSVISTAYPVQRLQDVLVVTPDRLVSQTTIPISLVPVWPSGPDELNPLYQSPSTGQPSTMLRNVAGGEEGVRFSDSCSGAVAVSSDGLVVTTLSVAAECTLHARVGNFTDLSSPSLSITVR